VGALRTWEGSAAVFAAGTAAALVALVALGVSFGTALLVAPAVAAAATGVEALSHHGTDNLTVQLAASLTALALVG
jgi:phytol kinase